MKYKISDDITFDIKNCHLTFNNSKYNTSQKIRDSFITCRKNDFNKKNKVIHTISLSPTYRCDGNCSYCYNISENNREKNDLTFSDFEKATNELKTKGYEIDLETLRLYGGEPLLVKNLSELIIQIKKKYKFDTLYISSGLLFNDEKFESAKTELTNLIENNIDFTIGISIDFGLLDKQFTRLSNKTKITRQLLLERCSILEDIGIRIVYATIVSENTDIDLLKKHIIDHYNNKSNKFNLDKMDTNQDRSFAYRISISNHNTLYPSVEKVRSLYDMYVELYETLPITSNLYPYTDIIYSPDIIQLDPDNFLFILAHTYCGIYTDMIAIFPGGEIGSCHMTPYDRNLKPTKEQYDYFFNNEKCNSCDFFGICRGLCVNRNLQAPTAMDSYCLWSQLSFKLSLKRLYLLNKNNFKEYITNKMLMRF
jgi:radical SAM protein with 4Fe4S-binding SPASM domain